MEKVTVILDSSIVKLFVEDGRTKLELFSLKIHYGASREISRK